MGVDFHGIHFLIEYRRAEDSGQADGLSRLPSKSIKLDGKSNFGMDYVVNAAYKELLEVYANTTNCAEATAADGELNEILNLFEMNDQIMFLNSTWLFREKDKADSAIWLSFMGYLHNDTDKDPKTNFAIFAWKALEHCRMETEVRGPVLVARHR